MARIDNAYGDRNLVCTCPSMEELAGQELAEQELAQVVQAATVH